MEIYRQSTSSKVYFEAPAVDTDVSATAALNGGTPITLAVEPVGSTNVRSALIPFIDNEGEVKVNWTFETNTFEGVKDVTVIDTFEVVTPILSNAEIKEIHPQATEYETVRIERAVRLIIQAHTGQKFGRYEGEFNVKGSGTTLLQLPTRILELDKVNGASAIDFTVENEGYALRYYPWGVPPVKADYYGWHMHVGGVIHNPNGVKLEEFRRSATYRIGGVWGWEEVPMAVREAAKLLVNDYACGDNAYRDRYLTSMTAADWRIQFNAQAFAKTGNVRADQLLSDYVLKRGWAVI